MLKALFGLGAAMWGVPIAAFVLVSLLMGKWHVGLSILALACASSLSGWVASKLFAHDAFEAFVGGTLVGMLLFAYPIRHYILG